MAAEYTCCDSQFLIRVLICILLVLFAGLMSGLTLGLMSLSLVELEVIAKSGSPTDRKNAAKIVPVVQRQHLLLCTLLICNAAAMEALPIFLDSLVTAWGAVLISVTLILLFGEIIPQAVCSRYGLAVGAAVAPLVQLLVWICFPVAYPISKLLDLVLGKGHEALFRRAELKTLVHLHGNEAGKGGELTRDETTIIAGALELTEKTARDAMTPISETFAIDINSKLDRGLMKLILEKGHSRIPVYYENPRNIIGLILVKNMITVNPDDEIPVRNVTIRKIPRISEAMPLYNILNEFQKGHSHMAVVVGRHDKSEQPVLESAPGEMRLDINGDERRLRSKRSLKKLKTKQREISNSKGRKSSKSDNSEILQMNEIERPMLMQQKTTEEEAIGIITLEDVIEELLQEEIYDETDHQYQIHNTPE